MQLEIFFPTGITCVHCHQDPGPDPNNPNLWNGFLDKDTNEHVCRNCGKVKKNSQSVYYGIHYSRKQKLLYANDDKKPMTFSEFPVMIK